MILMKKITLLLFAILPFGMGYLLNQVMQDLNWSGLSVITVSILYFLYWYIVGRVSVNYTKSATQSLLIGNSFAIISIIVIMFQEIIIASYLPDYIGTVSQLYYLPGIIIITKITDFLPVQMMASNFLITFLVLITVYIFGYKSYVQ